MSLRTLMPPLARLWVKADEIEGDVFQDGKIVGCMASTGTHLIVGEGDIHAPVQLVLDAPVRADSVGQTSGIGRKAGNVEALLDARLAPEVAF